MCQTKAATEEERGYAVFLTHDISLLRLFETFLESTPQLILVLYIILHMNKAETFQGECRTTGGAGGGGAAHMLVPKADLPDSGGIPCMNVRQYLHGTFHFG